MATTSKTTTTKRRSASKTAGVATKAEKPADVVPLEPPALRIPWSPKVGEMYGDMGVNEGTWRALIDMQYGHVDELGPIMLALSYAKARKLDIFKVPVYLVAYWVNTADRRQNEPDKWEKKWRVQNSIGDLRATAFRTGQYAGLSACRWGSRRDLPLTDKDGKVFRTIQVPEFAQYTVKRFVNDQVCEFEGPEVYWEECYQTAGRKTEMPNEMWMKRKRGQLAKCAEAAALRTAFPEELASMLISEEIEDEAFQMATDVTPEKEAPKDAATEAELAGAGPADEVIDVEAEEVDEHQHADEVEQTGELDEEPGGDPFEYIDSDGEVALFEKPGAFADKVCYIVGQIPTADYLTAFLENNKGEIERLNGEQHVDEYRRCMDAIAKAQGSYGPDGKKKPEEEDKWAKLCRSAADGMRKQTGRKATDDFWTSTLKALKKQGCPEDRIEALRGVYREHRAAQKEP